MATEKLIVELDAKTARLDARLINTEKKLDRLENQTKKNDKAFRAMASAGRVLGKGVTALAAAGTAAAAAMTAATVKAVQYGKELRIAANRSGESVEKLQSLAFATKTVGVDLNKLGDITKDTRERLGEFTRDGTGGFNDFVSVARLTKEEASQLANEFQTLTGTEVLQRMVTRMEEAGATAHQMSFALEGVASETTDLIPLLTNGGEKLSKLEGEFNDLGVTLTELDIKRISELGLETAKLGEAAKGASNKAVSVLSEEITQITQLMAGSAQDMGGLIVKAVTGYQVIVQEGAAWIANLFREAEIIALEAKSYIVGIFGDNSEIEAELQKLKDSDALRDAFDVKFLEDKWAKAQAAVQEYYGELKTQEEEAPEVTSPTTPEEEDQAGGGKSVKEEEELAKLREFIQTREELLDQQLVADLERLIEAGEALGISEGELYQRRLEIIKDFADKKEALENKKLKDKEKGIKKEEKWSESSTKKMMDDGTQLLNSLGNNSKTAHKIKQGLAASNAFMNTAEGVTDALADQNYASAAIIAATGAAQIAAILSSSPDSPSGGGGTPPASAPQQQQPDFQPDTTSLELSSATTGGASAQQKITFATDSGDQLMDTIATLLNKGKQEGRF